MTEVIFTDGIKEQYEELNGSKAQVETFFNSLIDKSMTTENLNKIFQDEKMKVYAHKCGKVNVILTLDTNNNWLILDFLFRPVTKISLFCLNPPSWLDRKPAA